MSKGAYAKGTLPGLKELFKAMDDLKQIKRRDEVSSEYISKQALLLDLREWKEAYEINEYMEQSYAVNGVIMRVEEGRFDAHGIENINPETREKIGRTLAEIRAEKAEGEVQRLKSALDRIHTDTTDAWASGFALRKLKEENE